MPTHCKGKKSVPVDKALYNRVKSKVKSTVKRWPSAYASGQVVSQYKRKGGKYRCQFGDLARWFQEKWIDICTGKPCGRKRDSKRKYPYCRPSKRVNSATPRTSKELTPAEKKRRCALKRKAKKKRIVV